MNDKIECKACKRQVNSEFNFCPYCGIAISPKAKEIENTRADIIKLNLINKLVDVISDESTLKLLDKIAQEIAK